MKIKCLQIAISLVIIFFIAGCTSSQPDEKEIEQQAQKIAKRFNGKTIKLFEKWNFDRRGMWYRAVGDTAAYYGIYHPKEDSLMLKVLLNQQQVFLNDFPADYNLNDRQLRGLYIREYNNEVNIQGSGDANKKYSLIENMKRSTLFKTADPFDTFSQLYKLRDSLDFREVTFRPRLGNFVEFYLYPNHILTYLPDSPIILPSFKRVCLSELAKGKMINKNWNLRKVKNVEE